jgi:hypothetical protein
MSVVVWVMMGIAFWHFAVLVPDRFWGGIVGAFLAAVAGALLTGFLLPFPGIPNTNPPGLGEARRRPHRVAAARGMISGSCCGWRLLTERPRHFPVPTAWPGAPRLFRGRRSLRSNSQRNSPAPADSAE